MTDIIPFPSGADVAEIVLPPMLLNSTVRDIKVDFITDDETGYRVDPIRYEASKVRGLALKRLPMPQLRSFCTLMGLIVRDEDTQSSLLEALGKKKLAASIVELLDIPSSDDEDDVEDVPGQESNPAGVVSEASNPSNQTALDVLKVATLDDVVIVPDKDADGNVKLDEHGTPVMVATTIKGVTIKSITMTNLRPFCTKVGLKGFRKKNKGGLCELLAYAKQMDNAHDLSGLAAAQTSQKRLAITDSITGGPHNSVESRGMDVDC